MYPTMEEFKELVLTPPVPMEEFTRLRAAFKGLAPDGVVMGDETTNIEIVRPGSPSARKPG